MTDPPSFNLMDAERHYNLYPHPGGILVMQLATGAHQDDHPVAYDAIWPAIRSDIKRSWGHKDVDDLERFLYNLYQFKIGEKFPYRWMFWRYPEKPRPIRKMGKPLKQLFWFDEQFTWEDFVEYEDGVACDSDEGQARGARNFSRLKRLLSCVGSGQKPPSSQEWDWLRGAEFSNSEVPF